MKSISRWNPWYFMMNLVIIVSPVISTNESFCATKTGESPYPLARSSKTSKVEYFGDLSIKLSVYYDYSLLVLHKMNSTSVETFINRTISSISLTFKQTVIQRVAKINFWIKNIQLLSEEKLGINNPNNAITYLNQFCRYTRSGYIDRDIINTMFTGHDIYSSNGDQESISKAAQGIARTYSLCEPEPCLLVEAKFYKAGIVLAHEIGHVLGMSHDFHDELNIMHNSTGRGKTTWSLQSINQMKDNFNRIINDKKWCLKQSTDTNVDIVSVDINEQCRQMFGSEFGLFHKQVNLFNTICQLFWCRSGPFILRGHTPLENTPCADKHRYCSAGQCVRGMSSTN